MVKVKVFYYRDYESHFVQTYGMTEGTKRYRDVTFPLTEDVNITRDLKDHALVTELEYDGESTDPHVIAEWTFMMMNTFIMNPLSAGFGLKSEYGADFETLSEEEKGERSKHNRDSVRGAGCGHTSMSVGDAVEIDGKLLAVASIGFVEVE